MRRIALTSVLFVLLSAFAHVPAGAAASRNPAGVFVHGRGESMPALETALAAAHVTPAKLFPQIGVAYAILTPAQTRVLAADARIERIERIRERLTYFTQAAHKMTKADRIYADPSLFVDADGNPVNGRGVGVAVVDSGVDGTHPDLAPAMRGSRKFIGSTSVAPPAPYTNSDDGGGHGTHVAGIVAGRGTSSMVNGQPLYAGVARGASIYGLGVGIGINVLYATSAFQWILDNHDKVSPPIRVVNNSWGALGAFDPTSTETKLVNKMIQAGIVVVWAAGNGDEATGDGGDGSTDMTTSESKNPTPGSIGVANYANEGTSRGAGSLDSSSSRGLKTDYHTWPDLAAPGSNIMSTCRLTLPVCSANFKPNRQYPNLYAELSGTSMAAPYIAGVVALILQERPELTPAQVENVLKDSAFKSWGGGVYTTGGDLADPGNASSFDKGHGLVDVVAALTLAQSVQ